MSYAWHDRTFLRFWDLLISFCCLLFCNGFYKLQSWHSTSTFPLPRLQWTIQSWLILQWLKRFVKSNSSFLIFKKFEKANSSFFLPQVFTNISTAKAASIHLCFMEQVFSSQLEYACHHLKNDKVKHALLYYFFNDIFLSNFSSFFLIHTIIF